MLGTLWNNRLTRSAAARIEKGHNKLLGIRRTMRLAKTLSKVRNASAWRVRRELYDDHVDRLLAENGPVGGDTIELRDGWAVDHSKSLPHLERLIADAQEIIKERGGVFRGGGERSFFQQILTDEHVARYPSILDFATSNAVLAPVMRYMKTVPTLSVSKPLGVRLAESDARLAPPDQRGYAESQLFHRDYHDDPMVYVVVALRDVTRQSGPFSILPASASRTVTEKLRYGSRGVPYRLTDDTVYSAVDRSALFEFACPAGSVLFVDSSACFHYGSRDAIIPRYLMMYAYVSVCRTDFGDLLRPECERPVTDDSARTRRAKYPVGPNDSRLRRLVLDRHAT